MISTTRQSAPIFSMLFMLGLLAGDAGHHKKLPTVFCGEGCGPVLLKDTTSVEVFLNERHQILLQHLFVLACNERAFHRD